ncbi:MAG: hypothetical protein ACK41F_07510 [Fimbriimonadaceae bacterium]
MRRLQLLLALAVALLPAGSRAQTGAKAWLESAMSGLRSSGRLAVRQQGTWEFDGRQRGFVNELWFEASPSEGTGPRLELRETWDGTLLKRTVADGRNLWVFEPGSKRYSVWNYGGYAEHPAADGLRRMLAAFRARAAGTAGWLARLLDEAWGSEGARWTPWIPFASETVADGRIVLRGPDDSRGFLFAVDGSLEAARLLSIRYAQRETIGGRAWQLVWDADLGWSDPPAGSFRFVPEKGAVPVVWPSPKLG